MFAFSWANKQLEKLSETLAPSIDDNQNRFHTAVKSHDVQTALALLANTPGYTVPSTPAVDPTSSLFGKSRAIHIACSAACDGVVHALIQQYGISPEQFDTEGNTPLHYAASSSHASALALVQSLVNDYKVSVTLKNANSQTAYDVATQDRIRQYLLPIQLQKETQECIDNGGVGLAPGIDMGGIQVPNRNLAPPPTMMGGASAGGGMKPAGSYVVPDFGASSPAPPGGSSMPPMSPYTPTPANPTYGNYNTTPSVMSPSPMNPSSVAGVSTNPSPAMTPGVPLPSEHSAASWTAPSSETASSSVVAPATTFQTEQNVPKDNSTSSTDAQGGVVEAVPVDTTEVVESSSRNEAEVAPVETKEETVSTLPEPQVNSSPDVAQVLEPASSSTAAAPTVTSATSGTPATMAPITNSTQQPSTTVNQPTNPYATAKTPAPSSYTSTHARRGHSTAGVLPKNSKYMPDGFHSSSSDAALAQKYGHDTSVGPPSGNLQRVAVGPPPSGGSSHASGGGTTNVVEGSTSNTASASINPFAGGTAVRSQYGRYGGGAAVGGRNRYPTYDAVSDSVGTTSMGGAYNNQYAMSNTPQYNVYQPPAEGAAVTLSYTSWASPDYSGGQQNPQAEQQAYTSTSAAYGGPNTTPNNYVEGQQQYPSYTQAYPSQQTQHYPHYNSGYNQEQSQYQQYQSNYGAPSQENMYSYNNNMDQSAQEVKTSHYQQTTSNNVQPYSSSTPAQKDETITPSTPSASQGNDEQRKPTLAGEPTTQSTGKQLETVDISKEEQDVTHLTTAVMKSQITETENKVANSNSSAMKQVTPFAQPISASELFGGSVSKVDESNINDTMAQSLNEEESLPPPPITVEDVDLSEPPIVRDEINLTPPVLDGSDIQTPPIKDTDTGSLPPLDSFTNDALSAPPIVPNETKHLDATDDTFLPPPPISDLNDDPSSGDGEGDLPPPPMFDISLAPDS